MEDFVKGDVCGCWRVAWGCGLVLVRARGGSGRAPLFARRLIEFSDAYHDSYVTLMVDQEKISGVMTPLADTGSKKHQKDGKTDVFEYTAKVLTLA